MDNFSNEQLVKMAKKGDNKALEMLFEKNEGLCVVVAKKYYNCGMDFEDRLALCRLNMMRAYTDFKPKEGKFATFAFKYMANGLNREYVKKNSLKRSATVTSLEKEEAKSSHGGSIGIKDIIYDESSLYVYDMIDSKVSIEAMVKRFYQIADKYERKYFDYIFLQGKSQTDTAKLCGVTKQRVNNVYKTIVEKLRIAADECKITMDIVA